MQESTYRECPENVHFSRIGFPYGPCFIEQCPFESPLSLFITIPNMTFLGPVYNIASEVNRQTLLCYYLSSIQLKGLVVITLILNQMGNYDNKNVIVSGPIIPPPPYIPCAYAEYSTVCKYDNIYLHVNASCNPTWTNDPIFGTITGNDPTKTSTLKNLQITIDISSLPVGLYSLRARTNNDIIHVGKLVKSK